MEAGGPSEVAAIMQMAVVWTRGQILDLIEGRYKEERICFWTGCRVGEQKSMNLTEFSGLSD